MISRDAAQEEAARQIAPGCRTIRSGFWNTLRPPRHSPAKTPFHNFLPQGTAAFKRQRNAIYSFPQRIGSDRAVGSRVLPACVSLRNTLRWQSQEAARIYVAESSRPEIRLSTEMPRLELSTVLVAVRCSPRFWRVLLY